MNTSSSTSLFRHLILDNPMTLESTRFWRRFLRAGSDTGRGVNVTAISLVAVLYLWILFAIFRYHEDMSHVLLTLEVGLLTLLVPGSMYAAISGERERLTWDGLIMTSLSPGQIVVGKLLSRVALILGIAALFVPPLALCYYYAVTGPGRSREHVFSDLLLAQAIIITWGFLLAGFSLWVSTKTNRPVTTLSIVTITLLSFLFLVPMLLGLFGGLFAGGGQWLLTDPPLLQIGAVLHHLHPLDCLPRLLDEYRSYTAQDYQDPWVQEKMVRFVPWIYLGGAFACILGAWKTLRGLEEPRVRS